MYTLNTLHGDTPTAPTVADLRRLVMVGIRHAEALHGCMQAVADTAHAMHIAGYEDEAQCLSGFWGSLKNAFKKVGRGISKAARWVAGKVKGAVKAVVTSIPGGKSAWNAAAGAVSAAKKAVSATASLLKGKGKKEKEKKTEAGTGERTFEEKVAAARSYREQRKSAKATRTATRAATPMKQVAPIAAGLASLLLLL